MATTNPKLQLISARITNYGCFRDSTEVPIDDVTALIAENENGKSTFLRALAWWGGVQPFDEEDRWEGAKTDVKLDLVALTFETNKELLFELRNEGILKSIKLITITRRTDNSYEITEKDTGDLIQSTKTELVLDLKKQALLKQIKANSSIPELVVFTSDLEKNLYGEGEFQQLINSIRAIALQLTAVEIKDSIEAALSAVEKALLTPLDHTEPESLMKIINKYLPKLIYFDETVDFVEDSVTYAEIKTNPSRHRTMINLASLADVNLLEIAEENPHNRQRKSRTAEKSISADFSKYWQGDPVTLFVQLDESQMTLTIENKGRSQRPSRRSSGLKWQLGFFVNFSAEVKGDMSGAILLLDEPGLRLHIKQQPKLLELFDDLSKDGCKIIYSTHLSQMLFPEKPHTYRPLIEDPAYPAATLVVPNITSLSTKLDVMQPVRQVLGMGIADAIGLGGLNIIAEGWTERYVLLTMSSQCSDKNKTPLNPLATILPAGGSGKKILPFAAMAIAEKTKVVVLVDDDRAGKETIAILEKIFPNAVNVIKTHDQGSESGFEIEDLIDPTIYIELVNISHANITNFKPIDPTAYVVGKPICDFLKGEFKKQKLGEFQKLNVALELQNQYNKGIYVNEITLDQFSNLFERLNTALNNS